MLHVAKRYKPYLSKGDIGITRTTAYRYRINKEFLNVDVNEEDATSFATQPVQDNEIPDTTVRSEHIEDSDISTNEIAADDVFQQKESCKDIGEMNIPKNLKEFMSDENFFRNVTVPVDKSQGEIFFMVIKYGIVNNLSFTALSNLFKLINAIFKKPILPHSSYAIDKLLNPKNEIQFHAVCHECSSYVGEFGKISYPAFCKVCGLEVDVKNCSDSSYFVLINPSTQISDLLSMYESHYDYVLKQRVHETNTIQDVYDGKMYRSFVNSLSEHDRHNYVSAVFNTDGAPKFKSSSSSIWPLFLKINEIPKQDRMNKLITCGLWFHKKKPDMTIFVDKFVNIINSVTDKGIRCNINGEERLVKLHILTCCVDAVARAPVQGIKQFNGTYGCNWCLHPGKWDSGMRYPIMNNVPNRNFEDTIRVMLSNDVEDAAPFGIRYPSPLINLSSFHIIEGFVPDYLHCCLEGVGKKFTSYFLETLSDSEIKSIDKKMESVAVPQEIARLCRPISCSRDWKGREWENFILYYSIPILSLILPRNKLNHWSLFVEGLYIFLKDKIQVDELNHADEMMYRFVEETEKLYGLKAMTYNLHQLLHIGQSVLNWGPLWTNSTLCFESANYYLLRAIKSAKGVTLQIVRHVNINHNYLIIEKYVETHLSDDVQNFSDILSDKVTATTKINEVRYFGKGDDVDDDILELFNLSEGSIYFDKIVKDGCLYESYLRLKKRSNNSFALLQDGTFIRIVGFIIDSNQEELTLYNIVKTQFLSGNYKAIKKITCIDNHIRIAYTKTIERVCVYVNISNRMYICPVPNLLHY